MYPLKPVLWFLPLFAFFTLISPASSQELRVVSEMPNGLPQIACPEGGCQTSITCTCFQDGDEVVVYVAEMADLEAQLDERFRSGNLPTSVEVPLSSTTTRVNWWGTALKFILAPIVLIFVAGIVGAVNRRRIDRSEVGGGCIACSSTRVVRLEDGRWQCQDCDYIASSDRGGQLAAKDVASLYENRSAR